VSAVQFPPLPEGVDDAVVAIQRRIDSMHKMFGPAPAAGIVAYIDDVDDVAPEYLAQRERLVELGLDPDVLAPIPSSYKMVGALAAVMTFPESAVRAWLDADGKFSPADIETVVSRLTFIPPGVPEMLAELTEGEQDLVPGRPPVYIDLTATLEVRPDLDAAFSRRRDDRPAPRPAPRSDARTTAPPPEPTL
jgi:hypothetical protein